MKMLYIIRHAKSSWKDTSLDDFDRPLNKRGKLNAPLMGKRLKKKGILPDIMLSSSSLRTKLTAQIIAKKLKYSKDIIFKKEMYESSSVVLHKILTQVDDTNQSVFIFAHNSGLNMLAQEYVHLEDNIPTCGIVEIEFDCDKWIDISEVNAKLISFDYPKKDNEL